MTIHTIASLAKMLDVHRNTLDYVVRTFRIQESGRAGGVRIYDADTARVIIESLGKLPRGARRPVAVAG